jgi:S1-C subfamily serine protease
MRAGAAFPAWGFVGWTGQMLDDTGYGPRLRRRGRGNMLTHTIMAVLGAALAAGLLLAFYNPGSGGSGISLPGSGAVPAPAPAAPLTGGEQAIVTKVKPGLVIINTNLQFDSEAAAGTGMVINPNGLVLTNNHVIDGSTKITATVAATGKTYPATVVGYDKTRDIALIQLQNASGLTIVPIGNSSSVKIGNAVVALGNAEGRSRITATPGEVTGLNQTITASEEGSSTASETLSGMIQTDADIVPGDSGGPLAGSTGVIGMDTAGDAVSDQQQAPAGFAIPINTALSVARQIAGGHASSTITIGYPPFVGIFISSGSSSSPQAQEQQEEQQNGGGSGSSPACYTSNADLTVPSAIAPVSSGTLIIGTICGSPAASADMTGGAVITAVNGQAVGSPDDLTRTLSRFHPGDTISVTWVSPSGQHSTSSLHLTAGPPQ